MPSVFHTAQFLFRRYFNLFHNHEIYGEENIPSGPVIIAPNHASFYDPPLICGSCRDDTYYLARASLFENRLFGWLLRKLNAYPVAGTTSDLASFKIFLSLLKEQKKVVIFPEGIRTFDGNLTPIKAGIGMLAQRSGCSIVPVYIHGTFEAWDRSRKYPQLKGRTACVFGKPIDPKQFEHLEKKEAQSQIAEAVRKSIEEMRADYEKAKEKQDVQDQGG